MTPEEVKTIAVSTIREMTPVELYGCKYFGVSIMEFTKEQIVALFCQQCKSMQDQIHSTNEMFNTVLKHHSRT